MSESPAQPVSPRAQSAEAPAAVAEVTEAPAAGYPLDDLVREVADNGKIVCPKVAMVSYRGDVIRYPKSVAIYEGFRPHLVAFEELARDTAIEVYGRAPKVMRNLGTYNCRRIRRWPTTLSEHGLANAIDVEGFDFGPAGRDESKDLPRALRKAFQVRVEKDWTGDKGVAALHAKFLRLLAQRVIDQHLFRVVLGPAEPGHKNHFHLDMAPWEVVNVF